MSQVLIEGTNPYGSLEAIVEDDGRTVYFYVRHSESQEWGMRALWIANRLPAPPAPDREAMQKGLAPLMPQQGTRYPQGVGPFNPSDLRLVWFEEGDGVALLQQGGVLAVVPPWAGSGGCAGYAHEAIGQTPIAWELAPALESVGRRIAHADQYWRWRSHPDSWATIRDRTLTHLEERLGPHRRYWAADGGNYPPRALAFFAPPTAPGVTVFATVGMSAQSMPQVEMSHEDPAPHRRIDVCVGARNEDPALGDLLSAMMSVPWQEITWLDEGHTYAWRQTSGGRDNPGRSVGVLMRQPPPSTDPATEVTSSAPELAGLSDTSGDPVNFLWLVPITAQEQAKAEKSGSASLFRELAAPGRGWVWSESPAK